MPNQTYAEQRQSFEYAVWCLVGCKQFDSLCKEDKGQILLSIEEELSGRNEDD